MTVAFQGSAAYPTLGPKVCRPCQSDAYHRRECVGVEMGCAHIWGAKEPEKEETLRLQVLGSHQA